MADRYQNRPFPGGDNYHRGDDPHESSRIESDPLAELARLIGQTDPFGSAATGRSQPPPRAVAREPYYPPADYSPAEPEDPPPAGPPPWMQRATRQEATTQNYTSQNYPDQDDLNQHDPNQRYAGQTYPAQHHPAQHYPAQHYPDPGRNYPREDHPGAEHPLRRYAAQHPEPAQGYDPAPAFAPAEPQLDPSRYDEALFGQIETGRQEAQYGQAYSDDPYVYQDGYDDSVEEEAPRRRGGLATVVAVLVLAVVGTGAAFAYRTYLGSPRSGEPPVIRADTSPTKIIPAPSDGSGKMPDRLASADSSEKIVPREEAPVDVNANVNSGARMVFPPLNQNPNPPPVASVTSSALPPNAGNGTVANSQPRKIKTLSFRGDDTDASTAPATPPPAPEPSAVRSIPVTRPAAIPRTPAAAANANASASNAPLSLAPQPAQTAPAPAPRTQVATSTPEPIAPSSVPGAVASGYMVQVSSQRNEADAQTSYRVLQGKFPAVLGSHSPVIRKADLGDKGIYYRAMVGPFGSSEEASQFCGSLRSAGGQCVIQRN
ncbi:SPOR domain-containing protein [Bradyrhizobium sp. dw_78]|uniref:SPOR domain-containing protein n=1 Tax=Bradyrhizobium sp. dw_78 TaxID=2719793 RepID=UPI001BD589F5|nr:SPOR domain-containing protein [Bradyrhizobium sp. dw_78]